MTCAVIAKQKNTFLFEFIPVYTVENTDFLFNTNYESFCFNVYIFGHKTHDGRYPKCPPSLWHGQ